MMNLLYYLYQRDFIPFCKLTLLFGDCRKELEKLEEKKFIFHLQDSEKSYSTTDSGDEEVKRWMIRTYMKNFSK